MSFFLQSLVAFFHGVAVNASLNFIFLKMSLKALVEVMIHVDTFRNIDLFYQGLYYMRFRLYYKRDYESLSK